jgi:hypothetical protein
VLSGGKSVAWTGKYIYSDLCRATVDLIFPRIEAQWITAKKDWREAKKRHKMQHNAESHVSAAPVSEKMPSEDSCTYEKAMDEMRCILFLHGGGCSCYFGLRFTIY